MDQTEIVEVKLDGGTTVLARVRSDATLESASEGTRDVLPSGETVRELLQRIGAAIAGAIDQSRWSKTTVEFGIELSAKSGVPFLAEGSAKGNMAVTMEFEPRGATPPAGGGA